MKTSTMETSPELLGAYMNIDENVKPFTLMLLRECHESDPSVMHLNALDAFRELDDKRLRLNLTRSADAKPRARFLLRNFAYAFLYVCVNAAARRMFWPGVMHTGPSAWAFNMLTFFVAAGFIWMARLRE